jgi:hypothetical protein
MCWPRILIHHAEVRILPPQPPSPAFGHATQPADDRPGNAGFPGGRPSLWTTTLPIPGRKSPKVSGLVHKNSRFGETIGGDGLDQDCRPIVALCVCRFSGPNRGEMGIYRLDCRARARVPAPLDAMLACREGQRSSCEIKQLGIVDRLRAGRGVAVVVKSVRVFG